MKSINLFKNFLSESITDFKNNKSLFFTSAIWMLIFCLLSCIPWEAMGFESGSGWEISVGVVVGILTLIVVANIILIEKARLSNKAKEKILYGAPSYLVYTLSSSLVVLAGIILLIIPGFLALVYLSMAPVAALLSENKKDGFLKQSVALVKKNVGVVAVFVGVSLGIEVLSMGVDFISKWQVRLFVGVLYSLFEALSSVILTMVSVKIYYYLNSSSAKNATT